MGKDKYLTGGAISIPKDTFKIVLNGKVVDDVDIIINSTPGGVMMYSKQNGSMVTHIVDYNISFEEALRRKEEN